MGQQWHVGEPKGGGFGSSDHFGTPAAPEEWFCLPAVGKWRVGRQWPVGEPKGCVPEGVCIPLGFVYLGVGLGGWGLGLNEFAMFVGCCVLFLFDDCLFLFRFDFV